MELTFLGHAALELSIGQTKVLIDPFLTGNPKASCSASDLNPSYIILTHAHDDHVGDTESIAKRCGAKVISSFEIVNHFAAKNIEGHAMNPGGGFGFPFGHVKFTPAWHSSSFSDGSYGGMPMGVVIEAEGKRIYHAGDTALFSDMQLIGRKALDLAFLPIGDNFTMGPEDAVEAAKLLNAKKVVPMHYNTFALIEQDPMLFKANVEQETSSIVQILHPGDTVMLSQEMS